MKSAGPGAQAAVPVFTFRPDDLQEFKYKLLCWAARFEKCSFLDNNFYPSSYHEYECLAAAGSTAEITGGFDDIRAAYGKYDWLFGYLGYDLKNETERLVSANPDPLGFPDLHFFVPEHVIAVRNGEAWIYSAGNPEELRRQIQQARIPHARAGKIIPLPRTGKEEYVEIAERIRQHILDGDVYEMNYCQEFYAEGAVMDPVIAFLRLNRKTQAPFSVFHRVNNRYLLCASPERFLKKKGSKLISQPIKGTIRRGTTPREDTLLRNQLWNDPKERAENVMITDLVRNDLHRSAKAGSVAVEELFGVYPFRQAHHMISTVAAQLDDGIHPVDSIRNAFPMGSMTGAPKIMAMELIELYERVKRGIFSGAAGYFDPGGDFDFNVVIRSILYNKAERYASYFAGSAITWGSEPEKEYEECLLKAEAMREVMSGG